jgi:aryl carrier-like protein
MAAYLARQAFEAGCTLVEFQALPTDRNDPARVFLRKLMENRRGSLGDSGSVRVSAERLSSIKYEPDEIESEPREKGTKHLPADSVEDPPVWDDRIVSIATELRTGEKILAELNEWRRLKRLAQSAKVGGGGDPAVPVSDTERTIVEAWKRALATIEVGTKDNFFEIGGTSIILAQVAVDLRRHGLEVSIVDLFHYPTVAELARYLSRPMFVDENLRLMVTTGEKQRAALEAPKLPAAFERLKRHRGK